MDQRNIYHQALELYSWELRTQQEACAPIALDTLDAIRQAVAQCTACSLHQSRTQTVFGVGNAQAELM